MTEQKWLQLDLQAFADGLDLDSLKDEFESSWEEPETETDDEELEESDELEEEVELDEDEPEEGDELETEESDEEEDENPEDTEEPTYNPPAKQTKEENAAFAKLRREKEELAAQASVLQKVAEQYGMSVEEFQKAYQEEQVAKQAKAENVPVEFFKKFNDTEQRLLTMEKKDASDKFNAEVESVKAKYGLADNEIQAVYDYIGQNGYHDPRLNVPTVSFDHAYKALNFDTLMERKQLETKQKMLADKKKRQKSSAKPHTNANASTPKNDEVTDDFVFNRLRERGLI